MRILKDIGLLFAFLAWGTWQAFKEQDLPMAVAAAFMWAMLAALLWEFCKMFVP